MLYREIPLNTGNMNTDNFECLSDMGMNIIGASLSEPHTSESNGGFFIYIYIYICIYYISAVHIL